MQSRSESVIWVAADGVKCVIIPYDEARYQLRMGTAEGTIQTDLFSTWADAIAAATHWRIEFNRTRSKEWP
jgi:hypothetical protein